MKDNKLEIISMEEDCQRCRCAHLYEVTIKNEASEQRFYIDLNHQASLKNGKIEFERNGKCDYSKNPYEAAVIHVIGCNGIADDIIRHFNNSYLEFEKKWKVGCKKEHCNNCMVCE